MNRFALRLRASSAALVERLDRGHRSWLLVWTMLASLGCGLRFLADSFAVLPTSIQVASAMTYALVIGAPIASVLLAFHWFRRGDLLPPPRRRLAPIGPWRGLTLEQARAHPLYGASGLMSSLILGILLNVPGRTFEFLVAMPLPGRYPPAWFHALYHLMLADVVLVSSLYAVAAVAALRKVPHFTRLIVLVWGFDIAMQLAIALGMEQANDLPPNVAATLVRLLVGNLQKVLVSVGLWAPYLLLSRRVSVTFRRRLPGREFEIEGN